MVVVKRFLKFQTFSDEGSLIPCCFFRKCFLESDGRVSLNNGLNTLFLKFLDIFKDKESSGLIFLVPRISEKIIIVGVNCLKWFKFLINSLLV